MEARRAANSTAAAVCSSGKRCVMSWQHVEPARKDQPRHVRLQGEIGRVTAEQIFLVNAQGAEIQPGGHAAARVR